MCLGCLPIGKHKSCIVPGQLLPHTLTQALALVRASKGDDKPMADLPRAGSSKEALPGKASTLAAILQGPHAAATTRPSSAHFCDVHQRSARLCGTAPQLGLPPAGTQFTTPCRVPRS
jgi:hypothetical protein